MKSIVSKPWGSYEIINEGKNYLIKCIKVKPGGVLSLQNHQNRSEHWIVVKGKAEVTLEKNISVLKENESIFIPQKAIHRLSNQTETELVIIEVWYGDSLDEEDIFRYEDIYER